MVVDCKLVKEVLSENAVEDKVLLSADDEIDPEIEGLVERAEVEPEDDERSHESDDEMLEVCTLVNSDVAVDELNGELIDEAALLSTKMPNDETVLEDLMRLVVEGSDVEGKIVLLPELPSVELDDKPVLTTNCSRMKLRLKRASNLWPALRMTGYKVRYSNQK